jgi:hypothetical protein
MDSCVRKIQKQTRTDLGDEKLDANTYKKFRQYFLNTKKESMVKGATVLAKESRPLGPVNRSSHR